MKPLRIEFVGEWSTIEPGDEFYVGRESELTIDENPYLHRRFLRIFDEFGLWWLGNVGSLLSATVSDGTGQVQAWLAPGAKLPIVFPELNVMFTAGSTTYDFTIHAEDDYFTTSLMQSGSGNTTTRMPVTLTTTQRQLILSLAEPMLRQTAVGRGTLPSNADAAKRLGWNMTTFNRKLDNVCDKLDRLGVDGLRGGKGKLATNRRARLVEYAVVSHLVSAEDLPLLDQTELPGDPGDEQ